MACIVASAMVLYFGLVPMMDPLSRVRVEVCATSVEEALAAQAAGADTVELCTWLAVGGVTPSIGLVREVRRVLRIPMRVLVRPRGGDFVLDPSDRAVLEADVRLLGASAAIVTGALTADGGPDLPLMTAVRALVPTAEITFHRAIDHARDPLGTFDRCAEAGIQRVLTSGGASRAVEGAAVIKRMVDRSHASGMLVAAAGGISPQDVVRLVEYTGVREVHFAAQRAITNMPTGKASLSSTGDTNTIAFVPDRRKMDAVLEALDKAGLR